MARKTIFLETAFWDRFSECSRVLNPYADGNNPPEIFERIDRWNSIFKFLCRSTVFIDSPLSELGEKAKSDPMLRHMLKCNGDGKMDLAESEEPFPDLESGQEFEYESDYSSLFFTNKDHREAARCHGVLNVCYDTIWNQTGKFKDTGEAIKTDKGFAWNKMEILRENSNGLVIVDNFILSPDRNGRCILRRDLRELLRLMLPDSFKEKYVLSIFYFDDSSDANVRNNRKQQFYQLIKDFVKVKKKGLNLVLELFPTAPSGEHKRPKDFHDRTIITNNVWIGSEAGFDLMVDDYSTNTNNRAIKTTKIHGLYLGFADEIANWLEGAYDDFILEAKQCLRKYKYTTENRILS